jgi:hypothetical protein
MFVKRPRQRPRFQGKKRSAEPVSSYEQNQYGYLESSGRPPVRELSREFGTLLYHASLRVFLRLLYIDRSFAFSLSNSTGVRIPRSFSFSNSSRRWMRFMGGAGATVVAVDGASD